MKVILVDQRHGHTRTIILKGWLKGLLSLCLLGAPVALGYFGYQLAVSQNTGIFSEETAQNWERQIKLQAEQLADIKQDSEQQLEALTLRLAMLQARLVRLDAVGDEIWSDFGHTTSLGLAGVASDTDDVIVAGKGGDAIDAGGNEVALSSNDAFFFTADHGGMIAGPTAFTDAGAQVPLDVAAGVGADFILAGYFTTGVDLGGGHGIGEPDDDGAFVGAVAKTGTAQWLTVALGLGNQRMRAVTTRLGNYIVAGTTDQSTTVQRSNGVGSTSLTHPEPGVLKVFWAELDESGIPTGTGIFTGTGAQHVHDLAAAGGDGFVTVGYHNGELTIPSLGSALTTGMRDGYAAMIHPNDPSKQWLTRLEGPLQQEITAAAVHSQAEVVIGGFYEGAATLRSSGTDLPLPDSTGNAQDMFVAGLDRATGRPLWVVTLHSEGSADALEELAVDSLGRVVVAGTFSGALTFGNRTTPDTASGLAGFVARFDPTTLP